MAHLEDQRVESALLRRLPGILPLPLLGFRGRRGLELLGGRRLLNLRAARLWLTTPSHYTFKTPQNLLQPQSQQRRALARSLRFSALFACCASQETSQVEREAPRELESREMHGMLGVASLIDGNSCLELQNKQYDVRSFKIRTDEATSFRDPWKDSWARIFKSATCREKKFPLPLGTATPTVSIESHTGP